MRILYLHQYFNTPDMNGSTRSYEMGRRLVASGHEVHIITSDRAQRDGQWRVEALEGMSVHWCGVPYSNSMSYRRRILAFFEFGVMSARRAERLNGDIVLASSTPLTIALPGIWASRGGRCPMVLEVRDLWPALPVAMGALRSGIAQSAALRLERIAYSHSERVIALSGDMAAGVARTGYPPSSIVVIPNACDTQLFDVPGALGERFRSEFDWLGNRPLVVYAGTLGAINGVEYLARVAAATMRIDPDVRFLVCGEGKMLGHVREVASQLGVLDVNFFMMPAVSKAQLPPILNAATLAVSLVIDLPAAWGNSANKFFDGLASGTPVVVNYGGWQADLLRESGAGLVVEPNDPSAAAARFVAALGDTEWLQGASRQATNLAYGDYSRDTLAATLEATLSDARTSWLSQSRV